MTKQEWQDREDGYLAVLAQLEEQENWAKEHNHHLLARAYSEGARALLNELSVLQNLRQDDARCQKDFTENVINLKAQGFFVEDIGREYGPQFEGQYRWMGPNGLFQDGDVSYSEVDAWTACINANRI